MKLFASWRFVPAVIVALALSNHRNANAAETRGLLLADSSKGVIALLDESGKTTWQYKIGPLHDLHMLANGHVLFQTDWTTLVEIDPQDNEIVWKYDAKSPAATTGIDPNAPVEIHAFQRISPEHTMVVESGRARVLKIDSKAQATEIFKLQVRQPDAHRDTRLVRQLENGHYLVCHEGEGKVSEYDGSGHVTWTYEVPLFDRERADGHGPEAFGNQCFAALRLANGNTLISTGNGHSILEVTPEKEIVWKLDNEDLPNIQLAWITTLQVLPSGNIVFGNCHAGPENPQVVEVNRDKRIVWEFRDFERFGNALTNTQVISVNGDRL